MGSRLRTVSNAAFGTCFLVAVPSYYFCYKTKILRKEMIESMMAANEFEPGYKAPDQPLLDDHPFLRRRSEGEVSKSFDDESLKFHFLIFSTEFIYLKGNLG